MGIDAGKNRVKQVVGRQERKVSISQWVDMHLGNKQA